MRFSYNLTSKSATVSISIEDITESISFDKVMRWINTSKEIFLSPVDIKATPLTHQNMSSRALNALKKNGITTLEELMNLSCKEIESIDPIGRKTKIIKGNLNKKEAFSDLPDSPKATSNRVHGPGHRTDEITSSTASIVYLNELKYINKALNIHYPYTFQMHNRKI